MDSASGQKCLGKPGYVIFTYNISNQEHNGPWMLHWRDLSTPRSFTRGSQIQRNVQTPRGFDGRLLTTNLLVVS
jgi:hypothetical protein